MISLATFGLLGLCHTSSSVDSKFFVRMIASVGFLILF
jgi:hypothetical protein